MLLQNSHRGVSTTERAAFSKEVQRGEFRSHSGNSGVDLRDVRGFAKWRENGRVLEEEEVLMVEKLGNVWKS